jgi:integrase
MAQESDLDLDGSDDLELSDGGPRWLIRGEAGAKAKRDRLLPLSPLAASLFRDALALPGRDSGGAVFRGKASGSHLSQPSISRAWGMLRREGAVPDDTTAHDLRRSARSLWPELKHGQPAEIMERILGHVVGSKVERVYDRAMWLPQQRAVLDAWSRKLITIASGGAQVVKLPKVAEHA